MGLAPTGRKISVALKEMGLAYTRHALALTNGDRKEPTPPISNISR